MVLEKLGPLFLTIFVIGYLFGCVTTEPLSIDLASLPRKNSATGLKGCIINIVDILDERTSKNDLGSVGPRLVHTNDVMPWIRQSVESVINRSIEQQPGVIDQRYRVDLTARLKKLYVHTLLTSISANVLLVMNYSVDQSPPETHTYRGRETSVNWTGSADSVAGLFDDAMTDALERLRADLQGRCRSKPS